MKAFIWKLLFIVSFAISMVFVVFGLYEEIFGPVKAKELLRRLHIPLSYNLVFAIGLICVISALLLYLLRDKLR